LLSVISAEQRWLSRLREMLLGTDDRGLRQLRPRTLNRSHLPPQCDWHLYYWAGRFVSVMRRQRRHELMSLLHSFLQTAQGTPSEHSGKPGKYSKYPVIYEHRRAFVFVFCVGPAITHRMYCSLPRLIVLTPLLVSPFQLQACSHQMTRETSISKRWNYGQEISHQFSLQLWLPW
jgi:hypothetical protein